MFDSKADAGNKPIPKMESAVSRPSARHASCFRRSVALIEDIEFSASGSSSSDESSIVAQLKRRIHR